MHTEDIEDFCMFVGLDNSLECFQPLNDEDSTSCHLKLNPIIIHGSRIVANHPNDPCNDNRVSYPGQRLTIGDKPGIHNPGIILYLPDERRQCG